MMATEHQLDSPTRPVKAKKPKQDKRPQVFVAVYDAADGRPDCESLKDHCQAKDVENDSENTFISLVKFKNYWENKEDIIAIRLFSPLSLSGLYTQTPNPLYLFAIDDELLKQARKLSHEIETFWAIKEVYCKAEMLISNNGFNLRNSLQQDSAIEPLKDYGRFLKIWSQDYKIWREHVEKFLNKMNDHAASL